MLEWLLGAAIGPAAVALPVNWAAETLAGAAERWFRRLRHTDDLSRLVGAATGASVDLTRTELAQVRALLEDQQTWSLIGHGSVEDLTGQIASCLSSGNDRTASANHAAALAIARGLLEFAVADLDPKLFQQVLLARLERMKNDQASALDGALLDLHAGFTSLREQMKPLLDRLPPGPARRGEIAVYLRTLIDWLDTDPWPRDPQFKGVALTPSVIERELSLVVEGRPAGQGNAGQLARQCRRLVIQGGPGSGKTWLAKRTARCCAEEALVSLAAGGSLEEVELPLYTTCSHLFGTAGDIRDAVVTSALNQLGDVGGSRVSAALRVFFTERNAPTLLVIDSLDEAHGPSDRLRQAGTLPWRIVLTTRPSSWRNQLAIPESSASDKVGELQPLRYPDDVEPFIKHWFETQPERGRNLAAQIAQRPNLQQAATVPLILAFYCIVGDSGALPEFRRDLYAKVLRRVLTGRWRGDDDRLPDADTCLSTLRAWAWQGAASNHPVSTVGAWTDDVSTAQVRLGEADADALDHVAVPLGPADVDTGSVRRRFIHRSIREHLVGEYVVGLPVNDAIEVLLPHLWYDPEWEYVVPAALAGHPERNQLVRDLVGAAIGTDQLASDLAFSNADLEFLKLLARVTGESSEADWSPYVAEIITRAREELVGRDRTDDLDGTSWPVSNHRVRKALITRLGDQRSGWIARPLAASLVQLSVSAEDKQQTRDALLALLAEENHSQVAVELATSIAQCDPAPEDKHRARSALLSLLTRTAYTGEVARSDAGAESLRQRDVAFSHVLFRRSLFDGEPAVVLARGVLQLDPTAEDKHQVRNALLAALERATGITSPGELAHMVADIAATAEDKRDTRAALLALLLRHTDGRVSAGLAAGVMQLDPTAEDRRHARDALLASKVYQADETEEVVDGLIGLAVTTEERRQALDALLAALSRITDTWIAKNLVIGVIQLSKTAADKRQSRQALLTLLANRTGAAERLASGVAQLDPRAEDKRQARDALLVALRHPNVRAAVESAGSLMQLDPTAEDKCQTREALLALLEHETNGNDARRIVNATAELAPATEDKRQAREAILATLGRHHPSAAEGLARGLLQLDPTPEDKRQAREAILAALPGETNSVIAAYLAGGLIHLDPSAEDKRQALAVLLEWLTREQTRVGFEAIEKALPQLDPTVRDFVTWNLLPPDVTLPAIRRNSPLGDWLELLPYLAPDSD